MTVWTGFAFEAIDGTLQGLPLPLSQLLVPVPYPAVLAVAAVLGIWTMVRFALPCNAYFCACLRSFKSALFHTSVS